MVRPTAVPLTPPLGGYSGEEACGSSFRRAFSFLPSKAVDSSPSKKEQRSLKNRISAQNSRNRKKTEENELRSGLKFLLQEREAMQLRLSAIEAHAKSLETQLTLLQQKQPEANLPAPGDRDKPEALVFRPNY